MAEVIDQKVEVIRCGHQRIGKKCNNVICTRKGCVITAKRHGREIKAAVVEFFPVEIVCERCGGITRITLEESFYETN